MASLFATLVLGISALGALFTAGSGILEPRVFAERLGLTVANPGGDNEVRAQYGGFFLAVAVFCAASLAGVVPPRTALAVLAVLVSGLVAGRILSLFLNRGTAGYGFAVRALCAIDAAGFALSVGALVAGASD